MRNLRVQSFHFQSSKGGSPHVSRLRINRLSLVSKFNYVLTHTRFIGSRKHSSFEGSRVG
jgi:hypothetical protein